MSAAPTHAEFVVLYRVQDEDPKSPSTKEPCAECGAACWIAESTTRAVPAQAVRICSLCMSAKILSGEVASPTIAMPSAEQRRELVRLYGEERTAAVLKRICRDRRPS